MERKLKQLLLTILAASVSLNSGFAGDSVLEWISSPQGQKTRFFFGVNRNPKLSSDGRFIVFESNIQLTPDDTNKYFDVYWFDREIKKLKRISLLDQTRTNGGPSISDDGNFVAFHSYPRLNLKKKNFHLYSDIYLSNLQDNSIKKLTFGRDGKNHDGEALYPQFVLKDQKIMFTSNSSDLMEANAKPVRQIYLIDRKGGSPDILSKNKSGEFGDRPSMEPHLINDGAGLYFYSAATNLSPGGNVGLSDFRLHFKDLTSGTVDVLDFSVPNSTGTFNLGLFDVDATGQTIASDESFTWRKCWSF
jgi:hypothetical protein